jgi:hypothetical protein
MALDQRKRRSAPARTGPHRALHAVADTVKPARPPGPGADAKESPPIPETLVAAAVKAAYEAVEQNVEEGRAAAERLRAATPPLSEPPRDPRAIANRLAYLTKDFGATCVELIVALLREPEVRAALDRLGQPADPRGASAPTPAAIAVTQRISSHKPIEVALSALAMPTLTVAPLIAGLHSLDAAATPIGGVVFRARPGGGLELLIDVPGDQLAGLYAGTVVDGESHQPVGMLAIKVFE